MNNRRTVRIFALSAFVSIFIMFTGCGSDSGDDDGNSRFYGTYLVDLNIADCSSQSFTVTIGNDSTRKEDFGGEDGAEYYLYIPNSGSSSTYTFDSDGDTVTRTITVENYLVTIEESWSAGADEAYTGTFYLYFADGYGSFVMEGSVVEANPDECDGEVTGGGTKE